MNAKQKSNPKVVILAGPNGAGKTTASKWVLQGPMSVSHFVNADIIARGLSGFAPESVAEEAGRIMLTRLDALGDLSVDFAFETTLASRSHAARIRHLQSMGYHSYLYFFYLDSSEEAVSRVAARVAQGGHNVPVADIRNRYASGLKNFFSLYMRLITKWRVYDNSTPGPSRLIAAGSGIRVNLIQDNVLWKRIFNAYGQF